MQKIMEQVQKKAAELLQAGTVDQVVAWRRGQFFYDNAPGIFTKATGCADLVYDEFCPANLSKYLMDATKKKLKTAVFLKPCDTYGVNQLLKDNRIDRKYFIALGTPCSGMLDIKKIRAKGITGITKVTAEGDTVHVESVYGNQDHTQSRRAFGQMPYVQGQCLYDCRRRNRGETAYAQTQSRCFCSGEENREHESCRAV
jgi:formate dehydrogenase subunit beta